MGCCESIPSRSIDPPAQHDQLQHPKDDEGGAIIYVENLPRNILATRIEKEFKKFGKTKSEKIRVHSEGSNGACAFIEFETRASAAKAIQASPLVICGRRVFIEEKRSSSWNSTCSHHNQNQKGHCQSTAREKRRARQYEECNTPCNSPNSEECNTACNSPNTEFSFPILLP